MGDIYANPTPTALYNDITGEQLGVKSHPLEVNDNLDLVEHMPDQLGNDSVKTFTLLNPASFLMIDIDNTLVADYTTYRARATVDGSEPSATTGFVCRSGTTTYLPFPTAGVVKVYLPSGTVGTVQAGRRG